MTTHAPPAPERTAPARRGRSSLGDRLTAVRALPMLPAGLLLIGFMLGPILYSLYLAFTDSAIRGEGAANTSFVGFSNFTDLLETAYYRPALPAYPEVSSALQEAMEAVMTGTSPEAAAAAYDAAVTDIVGPENVQEATA